LELTSIDLFCGAGGLSLGLEQAGFRSIMGADLNNDACATYERSFPKAEVLRQSVSDINFKQWRGADLLAGGPPCQPFSNGGKRLAEVDHRDMLPAFVNAVNEALPATFLMENVAGLLASRNRDYLESILAKISSKYTILPPKIVNASDFGVPQRRLRVIIIGFRTGKVAFPDPTHFPSNYIASGTVINRADSLGQPNPSKVIYAKSPDLRQSPYAGQLFNGGGRALNLDHPAPTILASAGGNKTHFVDVLNLVPQYHRHLWDGGKPKIGALPGARRLTVQESALLQTFPPVMVFEGSQSSKYAQIGNAVPPRLAEIVGTSIARGLH
jgi:DNA (cytosine-5)-methyltransferase 1